MDGKGKPYDKIKTHIRHKFPLTVWDALLKNQVHLHDKILVYLVVLFKIGTPGVFG